MNSVKAVINSSGRSAEAPEMKTKGKAVKDGSAHPHAGSDARVNFILHFYVKISGIILFIFSIITRLLL